MKHCPSCRQEFVASASRCADCDVDLVDDLAALDAAREQDAGGRGVRLVVPEAMAAPIAAWLEQARIPFRSEAAGALRIPEPFAEAVAAALARSAEVEEAEGEIRVVGPRSREPELPQDPSVVDRPLDEVAADPGREVPRLLALFATPAPRSHRRALAMLRGLEQRGVVRLADVVLWVVAEGYRRVLFGLVRLLAEDPPAGLAARVAAELPRLPAPRVVLALHVLAQIPERPIAPQVLPLLSHDDPEVRAEADEVLMSLSGRDMQFDAEAEPRERERAIHLWREWVATNARG